MASSLQCPKCAASLPATARMPVGQAVRCPKCTQPFAAPEQSGDETKGRRKRLALLGILITSILLFCGSGGWLLQGIVKPREAPKKPPVIVRIEDQPKSDVKPLPPPEKKPTPVRTPDLSMTADALAGEFMDDTKAALGKHRGQVIALTGTVDATLQNVITLKGLKKNDKGMNISCRVNPSDAARVAKLSRGQKLQVTGRFGDAGGTTISLIDCTVVELESSQLLTVPAETVAADFETSETAAQAKYRSLDAVIAGRVQDVVPDRDGGGVVQMKGTARTTIRVTVGSQEMRTLRRGQSIEFRAELASASLQAGELRLALQQLLKAQ